MKTHRVKQAGVSIFLVVVLFLGLNPYQSVSATTGGWTSAGALNAARANHTATLLTDGKVLVVGGLGGGNSSELYDPDLDSWAYTTGSLSIFRTNHTATLLANGKVLVVGGLNGTTPLASTELYDPDLGTWTVVAPMQNARYFHTATRLSNGQVLVVGGIKVEVVAGIRKTTILASAELYDPATNTWTPTGDLNTGRQSHTATLLPDGQVLVVGGSKNSIFTTANILATAELYDPTTGIWSTVTQNMNSPRYAHTATLLSNGKVVVVGGSNGTICLDSAELYDPGAKTWTLVTDATHHLADARYFHTATLLNDVYHHEWVLIAGGSGVASGAGYLATTELFDPAGDVR